MSELLTDMMTTLNSKQKELQAMKASDSILKVKIDHLQNEFADSMNMLKAQANKKLTKRSEQKLKVMKQRLSIHFGDFEELKKSYKAAPKVTLETAEIIDDEEAEDMELKVKQLQAKNEMLIEEVKTITMSEAKAKKEATTYLEKYKKSQAECEQVRGEVNVFTARIRSLVKEGQEKHKKLQQENSDLSKEIQALKEEKMDLLNKSNESEMKMKQLNEDLNTSMGSLSNSESCKKRMNSELESLKESLNALKEKNEGLEAEIANMNNLDGSEMVIENKKLREEIANLKQEAKERLNELFQSYEKLDLFEEMEEKLSEMKNEKSSLESENQSLKQEHGKCDSIVENLKCQIETLKKENEAKILELKEKNNELKKESADVEKNDALKVQNKKLLAALKLMRQTSESRKKELVSLYDELAAMEEEEDKCMRAMAKHETLQMKYDSEVEQSEKLKKENEELKKQLNEKKEEKTNEKKEGKNGAMNQLLAELHTEIQRMATDEIPVSVVEKLLEKSQ